MFSIVAAPWLASHAWPLSAAGLYLLFSSLCHQLPERSYHIWGHACALCHRCSGISLGLFAAALLPLERVSLLRSPRGRLFWAMASTLLLVADAVLPGCGIWTNTPVTRFVTGLLFGAMLASLAWPGLFELISQHVHARTPRRS